MMETILYVEDDLSLIDGLEYTLETNGYSLDNARTVKQAMRRVGRVVHSTSTISSAISSTSSRLNWLHRLS